MAGKSSEDFCGVSGLGVISWIFPLSKNQYNPRNTRTRRNLRAENNRRQKDTTRIIWISSTSFFPSLGYPGRYMISEGDPKPILD
jgi:hypothetical protein